MNRAAVISSSGRTHIEQVMRHARALGGRDLARADVHAEVDLLRVARNDLASACLGQLERQARLARAGGTDDDDETALHCLPIVVALLVSGHARARRRCASCCLQ